MQPWNHYQLKTTDQKPALLTRAEIEWLLGNTQPSKSHERFMRHSIKNKIDIFQKLELPLLVKAGYLSSGQSVSAHANAISAGLMPVFLRTAVSAKPLAELG